MKKKITLILLFLCILGSCGKKGDPEYKGSMKNYKSVILKKI